eukprot:TRINITY_DN267_c0_g1_i1.p1 TRINITY_DN267_c0_g1~~TRINITY_DN267_c0_g1_i1.p1  ORF type:complete len:355 (+),score=60.54 TRINITY_DN267_c0_g1_i1:122-1186(+)
MTWNIFCVSICLTIIIQGTIAVAQQPMAMGPMSMGGTGGGHNDTCIIMPNMSECANFHMPDPRGDITTLCGMMSNMPGCSIDNICHSNSKLHETEYCTDFSIVKNLCNDMPKMNGCQDITRMCVNGSVVKECDTPSLQTPKTMFLMSAIKKICTDMPMEQCSKCPDNMDCDLLMVYSELCYSMPDMDGCADWKIMCTNTAASTWPFCSFATDDTSLPPMRMWFHADVAEIILFKQWIPRNSLAFAGSWFAVVLMAFVAEFLRFLRQRSEQKWKLQKLGKNDTSFVFGVDVPRALFHTAQLGWGYIVMLLVMTYNVGLFFAVLTGHLIGSLVFGRFMKANPEPETITEDCCSTNP